MANRSYLIGVAKPLVFPTLRQAKDFEVIACKDWGIGLLWLALFHPDEWEQWKPPGEKGNPRVFRAPLAARKSIPPRLESAAVQLEQVLPKVKTWRSHLKLLQQAIDKLDPRYKFVTCEFQEIAALDPAGILDSLEWTVRFFAGHRVSKPAQTLAEVTGLKLNAALLDPATRTEDEFQEKDWKALGALLGYEWKKKVPWTPRKSPKRRVPDERPRLDIDAGVAKIKAALAGGAEVTPSDVQFAADKSAAILKLVLDAGGSPNNPSTTVGSALVRAFHSDSEVARKVNLLLDAGADPNLGGFKQKEPFVLCNCLAHGLELAPRIIGGTKLELLQKFVDWADSEEFQSFLETEGISWGKEFVALARKRLRALKK